MLGVYTESQGKKDGLLTLIMETEPRRQVSLWFACPSCPKRRKRIESLTPTPPTHPWGCPLPCPNLTLNSTTSLQAFPGDCHRTLRNPTQE